MDQARREIEPTTSRAGVRRALILIGCLVALAPIPYLVPGLEAARPFQPGSPWPFTNLFEFRSPLRRAALGGVTGHGARSRTTEELLAVAALPSASAPPEEPEGSPLARAGRPDLTPYRIPPEVYSGLAREIEEPGEGQGAMDAFYRQLLEVARDQPGALARITVYTVSTNGSDRVTGTLRRALQARFGDGGKGFLPVAAGWGAQEHRDIDWSFDYWRTCIVNRGRCPEDRPGLAGVMTSNGGEGSWASFATVDEGPSNRALSRFQLFYQAWPGGGEATLQVDDGEPRRVSTRAAQIEDRVETLTLEEAPHRLRLGVGEGRLRLYGVAMERSGPGVVVDGLMMLGASVGMMDNFDEAHLRRQVALRSPDLLVFWLGGNDVTARAFTQDWFVENYGRFIARARAGQPGASCLVLSVLDKGIERNGRIQTRRRVAPVVSAQRATAAAQGCAFFNLWEATGGAGTMARWYRSSPRLVTGDYGHMTLAGARVVGEVLNRALLEDYDDFLAQGSPGDDRAPQGGSR